MNEVVASTETVTLTTTIVIALLSGFVGALLPLVVQPYFNHRRRLYDRTRKHIDSLVKLELRLLDIDATLHDNKINFDFIVNGYEKKQMQIARLVPLELEDSFFADSFSGELNNKLYQFRYDLRRINSDINNFNRSYDVLANGLLTGDTDDKRIAMQLGGLLIDKDKLKEGFQNLQDECQNLLAYSKLRAKKDRIILMRYRSWILQRRLKSITDDEVQKNKEEYLKTINENQSDEQNKR